MHESSLSNACKAATPLAMAMVLAMAGCAGQGTTPAAETGGSDGNDSPKQSASVRQSLSNDASDGHAISVSGETKEYSSTDVTKTGDSDGDEADFYGTNAAVYAEEGANLTLSDMTVDTNGKHANAVFSYGQGTTVAISDSRIHTSSDCSGGIMVTGGGTLNASNLDIHTEGRSSAAIRSDRGGGTQVVNGGTYETDGMGSPAIYSTADVTVRNATLKANTSQGVVVEGKNSVTLEDVSLTASNTAKNSDKSDWYQAVMIYQSMSGDASEGTAGFSMRDGSIDNKNGDVFFVNNTSANITLDGASITNEDANGLFLRAAAAGWGKEGSNGGHVTLDATNQQIRGGIAVDSSSSLNLHLGSGSSLEGSITTEASGQTHVSLSDGAKWVLTGDSRITSLTCSADSIDLNGHTLHVGDVAYEAGTASTGTDIVVETKSTGQGGAPGEGGTPGDGSQPPAKPEGETGEPPAKPEGAGTGGQSGSNGSGQQPGGNGSGGQPPAKPSGKSTSGNTSSKSKTSSGSSDTAA